MKRLIRHLTNSEVIPFDWAFLAVASVVTLATTVQTGTIPRVVLMGATLLFAWLILAERSYRLGEQERANTAMLQDLVEIDLGTIDLVEENDRLRAELAELVGEARPLAKRTPYGTLPRRGW